MGLFTLKLKSGVGSNVRAGLMCVCRCVYMDSVRWDQIICHICVLFPVQELSPVSWKAAPQTAQTTNHRWEVRELRRSLALPPLTYSTLAAEMSQHNQRKPSPLQLCSWGNDAKVMQARSQLRYKVAIWERSANPAANVRSSGQLAEILPAAGVGERGWRCQQAGASAGEIRPAAWLLGWVAGREAARLAWGSRCTAVQTRARHNTCVLPSHPSPSLDGRTHRCLQSSRGQRTAPRSLWSRTKITTGDSGSAGGCAGFLKLGWDILQFTKRLQLCFDDWRRDKNAARCHSKLHH